MLHYLAYVAEVHHLSQNIMWPSEDQKNHRINPWGEIIIVGASVLIRHSLWTLGLPPHKRICSTVILTFCGFFSGSLIQLWTQEIKRESLVAPQDWHIWLSHHYDMGLLLLTDYQITSSYKKTFTHMKAFRMYTAVCLKICIYLPVEVSQYLQSHCFINTQLPGTNRLYISSH